MDPLTHNPAQRHERTRSPIMREVEIPPIGLAGALHVPSGARSLVVFAHGSGSSRFSSRNRAVANALNDRRIGTLLFDLLTSQEETSRANVFNIDLLAERLVDAVRFVDHEPSLSRLSLGFFGASTGAAAALAAAARLDERIDAIVSRGGRPDLAGDVLDQILHAHSADRRRRRLRRDRTERAGVREATRPEGSGDRARREPPFPRTGRIGGGHRACDAVVRALPSRDECGTARAVARYRQATARRPSAFASVRGSN